jgi:protein Mpv17
MMVLRALQRTAPVRAYARSLETHPLPTKCATSGALMVVSDVMRQKLEKRDADDAEPFRWDAARSSRLALWAVVFHAPYLHWLHPWYERMWLRYRIRSTVVKVALDQTLMAPPFLFAFLTYSALAEGSDPGQRVREQLPALWTDSVWFWSLAHCVTFNLPVPVRVLWQDVARIYFGSLMSLRANAPLADEARRHTSR